MCHLSLISPPVSSALFPSNPPTQPRGLLTPTLPHLSSFSLPSPFFPFHLFLSTEIHKNVISPLEGDTKEHVLQQKHTELKQKMKDLNQGFERLRKLSHEGFTEDSGESAKKHRHTQLVSFFESPSDAAV